MASGAPDKIHVVTVDYRGFGYSTGNPTERGLIDDGIALLNWALNIAHISPNRIVILGQSLGTAVATAVAERFVSENQVEFSGLILVAAFTDIPTLVLSYSIGGIIPILSPIRPYPFLQSFFAKHVQETWKTNERLANLVRKSDNVDLTLIHSRNDNDIPWQHSQNLFYTAANATSDGGMTLKQMDSMKMHSDLGDAGSISTWAASGKTKDSSKNIGLQIVRYGGKKLVPQITVRGLHGSLYFRSQPHCYLCSSSSSCLEVFQIMRQGRISLDFPQRGSSQIFNANTRNCLDHSSNLLG